MARSFEEVVKKIMKVAPKSLRQKIKESIDFWAPESRWYELSECVNRYVRPNSNDPQAIKIYAVLCDCTEDEIRARFQADGI